VLVRVTVNSHTQTNCTYSNGMKNAIASCFISCNFCCSCNVTVSQQVIQAVNTVCHIFCDVIGLCVQEAISYFGFTLCKEACIISGTVAPIWSKVNFGSSGHHHPRNSSIPCICTIPSASAIFKLTIMNYKNMRRIIYKPLL
jgi:hypothetical protein